MARRPHVRSEAKLSVPELAEFRRKLAVMTQNEVANTSKEACDALERSENDQNRNWLPDMDSNHELDKILMFRNLLILQSH